jgi:hypothetical protein
MSRLKICRMTPLPTVENPVPTLICPVYLNLPKYLSCVFTIHNRSNIIRHCAMAPLNQPWKNYLAQKVTIEEASTQALAAEDSGVEKDEGDMCPGSAECGHTPHPLGSTVACAYRSHMACEVVMQGSTGTSG